MSFPIAIYGNRLRFGDQDVPVGNAQTALFFHEPKRGMVVIIGLKAVDGRVAKYKLLTRTYEKTASLFWEIMSRTDIKINFTIKNITRRDGGLDFEFFPGDSAIFYYLIAPYFFPDTKITCESNLVHIQMKKKQLEKIRTIFEAMANRIGSFQFKNCENHQGDPKFIIESQDKQVVEPRKTRVFVLDGRELAEMILFQSEWRLISCTQNIMLDWIYGF